MGLCKRRRGRGWRIRSKHGKWEDSRKEQIFEFLGTVDLLFFITTVSFFGVLFCAQFHFSFSFSSNFQVLYVRLPPDTCPPPQRWDCYLSVLFSLLYLSIIVCTYVSLSVSCCCLNSYISLQSIYYFKTIFSLFLFRGWIFHFKFCANL